MYLWLTMILAGVLTYTTRLSFIILYDKLEMSNEFKRALQYVPPAVLTAIIFPDVLVQEGIIDLSVSNSKLIAGILATVVAWRTKSVVLTILVGMGILWIIQVFFQL